MVILKRNCAALLIPSAVPITIPSGTEVKIIQQLGDTFTINISGQLARIDGNDRDALGIELTSDIVLDNLSDTEQLTADGPVDINEVWQQLRSCYDPEIPVNIVELGLIYKCEVIPDFENKQNEVQIQMTLTAPGCGMGPVLANDIKRKVRQIQNVTKVEVELVFDPPWNQEMMSEAAKLELGLL